MRRERAPAGGGGGGGGGGGVGGGWRRSPLGHRVRAGQAGPAAVRRRSRSVPMGRATDTQQPVPSARVTSLWATSAAGRSRTDRPLIAKMRSPDRNVTARGSAASGASDGSARAATDLFTRRGAG